MRHRKGVDLDGRRGDKGLSGVQKGDHNQDIFHEKNKSLLIEEDFNVLFIYSPKVWVQHLQLFVGRMWLFML